MSRRGTTDFLEETLMESNTTQASATRPWGRRPIEFKRKRTGVEGPVKVDLKKKERYFEWEAFRFVEPDLSEGEIRGTNIGVKIEPTGHSKKYQPSDEQLIENAYQYKPYTSASDYINEFKRQRETLSRWGPTQWPDYFTMEFESQFLIGVPKRRSVRSRGKHGWVKSYVVPSRVHYNWDSDIVTLEQGGSSVTFSANDLRLILRDCDLIFEGFSEHTTRIRAKWPPVIGEKNRRARISVQDAERFRKELYNKFGRV